MFLLVLVGNCSMWALLEADQEETGRLNSDGLLEMMYLNNFKKKKKERERQGETEQFIREEPFLFNIHSGPCLGLFW